MINFNLQHKPSMLICLWRDWILDCKLHWHLKFFNHSFKHIGSKTLIEFRLVGSKVIMSKFLVIFINYSNLTSNLSSLVRTSIYRPLSYTFNSLMFRAQCQIPHYLYYFPHDSFKTRAQFRFNVLYRGPI